MTNILYFHNTIRDDESLDSTSTEDEDLVCDPKSLRFDELNSPAINFRLFGKGIPVAIRDDESIVSRETPFISSCSHQQVVSTPLSWSVRMKIALGAAKGLAFLHSAPINVIHRGFITSNILLDKDYNAKLSGFKLARDGPNGDKSHVSTRVMGTYGYAAPEYIATGQLTAKSDVYTFGVILLEMLSGRRAMDSNRPSEERFLVKWAEPYLNHKRKVYHVADSRLEGQYSLEGFQKAANLALICLSMEGISRPNMDEVVKVLGELQNFKDKNHPK